MASRLSRYSLILTLTAAALAVLLQVPQALHMLHPASRGIPVQLNSDEDVYLAHLQESLSGRPEQSSEAIIGDSALIGTHTALLERIEGTVFRFSGWRAATVEQVMDSIVPVLIFLALVLFFRLAGASRWLAYAGALAFVIVEIYSLSRPVQPRGSFLLLILAFSGIIAGLERRWWWGIIGGALLGALIGAYFWAWTFGWLWWGLLGAWEAVEWLRTRRHLHRVRVGMLLMFGLVGVIAAVPALMEWWTVAHHPLYEFAAFRSGMRPSHLPESWPYSALFFLMAAGIVITLWPDQLLRDRYRFLLVTIVAGFVAINQQVIHGISFYFVSHYIFPLATAAICVLILAKTLNVHRRPALWVASVAALVYLTALVYDGRYVINQFTVKTDRFDQQHFVTLLPVLDELPRATILSDPVTSLFLASSTRHDVVYTLYLKNLLMTHEEIARRYCLTQVPVPAADRHLESAQAVYPDAISAFRDDPSVAQDEIAMLKAACASTDANPAKYMTDYGAQYVLWNEKGHPEWSIRRLRAPLIKTASGSGWSLFRVSLH